MDGQRGIARRMVIGLPEGSLSPGWERDFAAFPPAGVIVFRRDFRDLEDLRRLTTRLRELARPRRLFLAIDEEGGWVSQLDGHLLVPPNAALLARGAADGDIAEIHTVTARRLRALGLDWDFAPVADIHSESRNPVIGPRAFGSDPAAVARAVGEALRGLGEGGLATCLKHFPGHGDTELDSHLALPVCRADLPTLEGREMVPFSAHLEADAVMTAHVVYPALDAEAPGTFSPAVVTRLLRERLGFRGVCITDALEMKGASQQRTHAETGRLALAAGCDLLLYAFHDENLRRARLELADALVDGAIDRVGFDASRPRLAGLDASHPEPTTEELARPLDSLTPDGWRERLIGVIERGLIVRGALGAARSLPWRVSEPEFPRGAPLSQLLIDAGEPVTADPAAPAIALIAVASRVPISPAETERLRAAARAGPTALVGLQNDAFLDDVPEAALRLSASDATGLTREVVARRLRKLRNSS